jgi:hypothetical protein
MSLQFLKAIQVAENQGLISRRDASDLTTEYIESELTISEMGKVRKAFDAFKQSGVL